MSAVTTLARPYAKAAFELARSDNKLAGWDDMLTAVAVVTADDGMANWLRSPHATADQATAIIAEAIGPQVDPRFNGFLSVLSANDRLSLCGEITRLFRQLRAAAEKRLQVRVVSAVVLQDSEVSQMRSALAKRFDRDIVLDNDVDPEILGGAIIYAGGQVIDGSLTGRLKRLEASLS